MFSKTSDYDADERLVRRSAESLLRMKERSERPKDVKNCKAFVETNPNVDIAVGYAGFPVGFCADSLAEEVLNSDEILPLFENSSIDKSYLYEDDTNFKENYIKYWLGNAIDLYFFFFYYLDYQLCWILLKEECLRGY